MAFDTELDAFEAYARAQPNNCIFLVDTYDTLEGVRNAARVGRQLAARGQRLIGIRLDSGDLAEVPRSRSDAQSTLIPNFLNFSVLLFSKLSAFSLVITVAIPEPTSVSFGGF